MDKEKGEYKEGDFWISYGELANALEGTDLSPSVKERLESFVKKIKSVSFERENALIQSVQNEGKLQTEVDRLETDNKELEKSLDECEKALEKRPDLETINGAVKELLDEVFRKIVGSPIKDLSSIEQGEIERLQRTFVPRPE